MNHGSRLLYYGCRQANYRWKISSWLSFFHPASRECSFFAVLCGVGVLVALKILLQIICSLLGAHSVCSLQQELVLHRLWSKRFAKLDFFFFLNIESLLSCLQLSYVFLFWHFHPGMGVHLALNGFQWRVIINKVKTNKLSFCFRFGHIHIALTISTSIWYVTLH